MYGAAGLLAVVESDGMMEYLTADHLGTPRITMKFDTQLKVANRRDYYPFGEELTTFERRTHLNDYNLRDYARQRFTAYERDVETGLDFAQARYYTSFHGRFTSIDPLLASGHPANPQSWNRYAYVGNRPLSYIDPSGLIWLEHRNSRNQVDDYKWIEGSELSQQDAEGGWGAVAGGGVGLTYTSMAGDLILLRQGGNWTNLGYVGKEIDFQHGLGSDFAEAYVRFAAEEFVNNLIPVVRLSKFNKLDEAGGVVDDVVTLWKAPQGGRAGVADEVIDGFSPQRYPGLGPFFSTDREIAENYQRHYRNGLQEINIPRPEFENLVGGGVVRVDTLEKNSFHVPAKRLTEFNRVIKLGPPNRFWPQ